MKRSRVALLLFMATFAGSLLAAGMAGGEGGAIAQPFAGSSTGGGYCEFAYDPVDEQPYDLCNPESCEFGVGQLVPSAVAPQNPVWSDDGSLDYQDGYGEDDYSYDGSMDPVQLDSVTEYSAGHDQPRHSVPADSGDEFACPDIERQIQVEVPNASTDQVLQDPTMRNPYDLGPFSQHWWPELYGDSDFQSDAYASPTVSIAETGHQVSDLLIDITLALDELLGRERSVAPADFVRRIESPSGVAGGPEAQAIFAWGRQVQEWIAQQDWLAQQGATIHWQAQFYLQGLTPPSPSAVRVAVRWSTVNPADSVVRFVSGLWAGYRDAAWGLSRGASRLASFSGLLGEPIRQAHDASVRTRTSLRTPWRIDL
jgi:hypothetical protein